MDSFMSKKDETQLVIRKLCLLLNKKSKIQAWRKFNILMELNTAEHTLKKKNSGLLLLLFQPIRQERSMYYTLFSSFTFSCPAYKNLPNIQKITVYIERFNLSSVSHQPGGHNFHTMCMYISAVLDGVKNWMHKIRFTE